MCAKREFEDKQVKFGQKQRKKRNTEIPAWTTIYNYTTTLDEFYDFLLFHHIWAGITIKQITEVKLRLTAVQKKCSKKV